jgi:hypothetical protein
LCELHMSGFDDLVAAVFAPVHPEVFVTVVCIGATRAMIDDDHPDGAVVTV